MDSGWKLTVPTISSSALHCGQLPSDEKCRYSSELATFDLDWISNLFCKFFSAAKLNWVHSCIPVSYKGRAFIQLDSFWFFSSLTTSASFVLLLQFVNIFIFTCFLLHKEGTLFNIKDGGESEGRWLYLGIIFLSCSWCSHWAQRTGLLLLKQSNSAQRRAAGAHLFQTSFFIHCSAFTLPVPSCGSGIAAGNPWFEFLA